MIRHRFRGSLASLRPPATLRATSGGLSSPQSVSDLPYHFGHLILRQLRKDRDGQRRRCRGVRVGERFARRWNIREALLLRQRQRVVNLASDAGALQMMEHTIARGVVDEADDVLV